MCGASIKLHSRDHTSVIVPSLFRSYFKTFMSVLYDKLFALFDKYYS